MTKIEAIDWYEILDIPGEVIVLGEVYTISIVEKCISEMADEDDLADGMCSVYHPLIEIYSDEFEEYMSDFEMEAQKRQAQHTFKHEVIHALFIQSGLDYTYGEDEKLVDFLAVQIPKIKKYL